MNTQRSTPSDSRRDTHCFKCLTKNLSPGIGCVSCCHLIDWLRDGFQENLSGWIRCGMTGSHALGSEYPRQLDDRFIILVLGIVFSSLCSIQLDILYDVLSTDILWSFGKSNNTIRFAFILDSMMKPEREERNWGENPEEERKERKTKGRTIKYLLINLPLLSRRVLESLKIDHQGRLIDTRCDLIGWIWIFKSHASIWLVERDLLSVFFSLFSVLSHSSFGQEDGLV